MPYEPRHIRPISPRRFALRLLRHIAAAAALVAFSIAVGMAGYEHYEHLAWRDAFLNATMLLGGMGPVDAPLSSGGKLFAGCYALYAGLVFILTTTVMAAPILHRVLHHFHWSKDEGGSS